MEFGKPLSSLFSHSLCSTIFKSEKKKSGGILKLILIGRTNIGVTNQIRNLSRFSPRQGLFPLQTLKSNDKHHLIT